MTVTSMIAVSRKNPESPERGALRAAIARVAEVRQEASAIESAIESAASLAMVCRGRVEAVAKAVTAAQREDAERLADSLIHGGTAPPQTVGRAREEQLAAADALGAARSAITRLEADLKHVQYMAEGADKAVRAAIAEVLRPMAKRLTEEAAQFRAEYLKRQHVMDALAMRLDGFTHIDFSIQDAEHRALCATVRQPWFDVIERLKRDASTELLTIEDSSRT
jgi:hypothetical protein